MKRFIKIFTTLAGLTLMTACGNTQGLIDALTAAVSTTDRTAVICVQNPFNALCDDNAAYQSTRDTIERSCRDNPNTSDNCVNFVAFLCIRDNPYDLICTQGENDYRTIQNRITDECIRDGEGPLCDRAIAATCTQDPFDRLCLTDLANQYNQGASPSGEERIGFAAERALVCDPVTGSAPDSQRCGSFIRAVCDRNPLDALCDNRAEYFVARDNACWIQGIDGSTRTAQCAEIHRVNNLRENAIPACQANYVDPTGANRFNPRCYNVVIGVCNLNPFDALCDENTNYLARHRGIIDACTAQEPDATFCVQAKTSVCADNPFDPLCLISYTENTNDYATERQTAINDCQTTFVAGERCEGAAGQFCTGKTLEDDLFNPLCLEHPGTDTDRQPTCFNERVAVVTVGDNPITARCATTATRICDGDSLDPLCEDVVAYRATQFSDCVQDSDHASCAAGATQFSYITPVIACLESPFSAACLDVNTEAGAAFVPHAEAAQDAYCEGGATTKIATADRVNCTNIGSLPDYPSLANEYEFVTVNYMGNKLNEAGNGYVREGGEINAIVQEAKTRKAALGGFLKTGVYGTGLGVYTGRTSVFRPNLPAIPATFDENTGNFDRKTNEGSDWVNLPVDTTAGLPAGYPISYSVDPNTFTPAPAGTTPKDRFIQNQRIYEFASPVDSKDGFIFFVAFISDERGSLDSLPRSVSAYAGIQATSNFGAPLAAPVGDAPTSAIWAGQFTAHTSDRLRLNAHPTNFYVDFTDRTFNIHNPTVGEDPKTGTATAGIGSGSLPSESTYYQTSTFTYAVNGIFGVGVTDPNILYTNDGVARTLNAGELSGNVTFVNSQFDSRRDWLAGTTDGAPTTTIMPLTGLIGVEGAVGVYLNPNPSTSALSGGFTASAPAPTN